MNRQSIRAGLKVSLAGASLALTAVLGAQPAFAQDAPADEESEAIVVTGSRIAREGFDASTPVSVVDAQDIKLSGSVNVERILSENPQFVASTNGGASANTVPGGIADLNLRGFGSTRNLVLVNGRRFAIHGPSQVTDINTIPAALIERTEVVTGGSSAVYGSDAITGVVNFVMRKDFSGVEVSANLGLDSSTTTLNKSFDLTVGGNFAEDRGNIVVSLNYMTRGGITRGERGGFTFDSLSDGCVTAATASPDRAGTPLVVPSGQTCRGAGGIPGFVAGGSGDIPLGRISFDAGKAPNGANAALNAAYIAAGVGNAGSFGITFDATGKQARAALDPQDRFNLGPDNYLIIPQERWMANMFSHYDLTDSITGYAEFHYSNNRVKMRLAPSNVGTSTLFDVNNPYLSTQMQEVLRQLDLAETLPVTTVVSGSASRTTTPGDGLAVITFGKRYVGVGPRMADEIRNTFRATAGLGGDIGANDLKWDIYYTYARTETTEKLFNAMSRSRLQAAELRSGSANPVCNVFGDNITEACATAVRISATNTTEAEMQVAQASLTGTLFKLPAGNVGFSVGAEWRAMSAAYAPDSFLSSGDVVGFNAGLPTSGKLSAKEVFGEIRVPILSSLTANGAFRYSDYSLAGIGGVWTYLGGLEFRPIDDVTLRGQYQRAIRAPNVGDLFGGVAREVPNSSDPCSNRQPSAQQTADVRAVCVANGVPSSLVFTAGVQPNPYIPIDTGGNPNLAAERSDTWTAGIVVAPRAIPRLRFSIDYFNIKLDGAISQLGGGFNNTMNLCFNVLKDPNSEFCKAIRRDPATGIITDTNAAQIRQANTGGLKTSGVDLVVRYSFDLGGNRVDLATDWTWTNEFTATPLQALPNIQNKCVGSFGLTCGEPIPEWHGSSRVTYNIGTMSFSLRHRFLSSVTTDRYLVPLRQGATPPALDTISYPKLPSRHYFDLSFNVEPIKNIELFGGARNIFGAKPPVVGSPQVRANTYPATYDVLGTEFFLGATAKF